jgi:hypothetical protein
MLVIDAAMVSNTLGHDFSQNFAVLPAQGIRGGVLLLLACSQSHYAMSQVDIREFSVTATITNLVDNSVWTVTGVYGPQEEAAKQQFLQEMRQIKPTAAPRWILLGDFNLIYRACDKSNSRVNRRLISAFRAVLEDLEIKELQLHGRRFTWSSGTANPTLSKIDHVFVSKEWELYNPHCYLQALSSTIARCSSPAAPSPSITKASGLKQAGYRWKASGRWCTSPGTGRSERQTRAADCTSSSAV